MKTTGQEITVNGLRFYAYHGVDPQERIVGSWFTVNLKFGLDAGKAIMSDELSGTASYADAVVIVRREMAITSDLLEHVAGRIAKALLAEMPPIQTVTVSVCKENPPVCAVCESAAFTLTVQR